MEMNLGPDIITVSWFLLLLIKVGRVWRIIRSFAMLSLLTYAEARVQNNGWDEKVQHALNDLRDRCGMPNVPNSLSKMRLLSWYAMSVVLSWQPKVIVTMIYVVTDWNIVVRR